MARPKGCTTIRIWCSPTGSRLLWQTTFVKFEEITLQIALFTVTCKDCESPENPVPVIYTSRSVSPSERRNIERNESCLSKGSSLFKNENSFCHQILISYHFTLPKLSVICWLRYWMPDCFAVAHNDQLKFFLQISLNKTETFCLGFWATSGNTQGSSLRNHI